MEKLHLSTFIQAPRERVWETTLGDATYREWTAAFTPGSHYVGEWETGSKMLFLGPDPESGKEMGMASVVVEARPYEFVSLRHEGIVVDGVEDRTSEMARKWVPAFENYTFKEKDGGTEFILDMDVSRDEKANMEKMWTEALKKLKSLAER